MLAYLTCIGVGLGGLLMMALPGMRRHGGGAAHAHAPGLHSAHSGGMHALRGHARVTPPRTAGRSTTAGQTTPAHGLRLIPSPRMVFSLLVLYGACGYALAATHIVSLGLTRWLALVPALLLERYAITPYWNALFEFESPATTPLMYLVMSEAEAVTEFRNGRGIVRVVRDGRAVQMSATLQAGTEPITVRVGDKLRIEDVDSAHERVTVSRD